MGPQRASHDATRRPPGGLAADDGGPSDYAARKSHEHVIRERMEQINKRVPAGTRQSANRPTVP